MAGILIDTNILVCAHDRRTFDKQARAVRTLDYLSQSSTGCLSSQTLAEFFRAATRGSSPILTIDQAARQVELLSVAYTVHPVTSLIVAEATRGVRRFQLAFWDAQLWATARLNQVPVIFSEDFNVGASLDGVRFVNPLADDFAIEKWA